MQKIKILRVVFNETIEPQELPAFRGAIATKAGKENILFHNHNEEGGFRYAYPLIQYKLFQGNPVLLCIGEGVEEVQAFFDAEDWSLRISGREIPLTIKKLYTHQAVLQVWDQRFSYRIHNWIALNQESVAIYEALESLAERCAYLEKKLIGNILSFAKGMDWHIDKPIELKIQDILPDHWVSIKGTKVRGFNLRFTCNVSLPDYIGLGKSVSLGWGVVKGDRKDENIK